jgi:hypothetical protein
MAFCPPLHRGHEATLFESFEKQETRVIKKICTAANEEANIDRSEGDSSCVESAPFSNLLVRGS